MKNRDMHVAKRMTTVAYADNVKIHCECKEPKCMGWDDCTATWNKKKKTLTVECDLCGTRYIYNGPTAAQAFNNKPLRVPMECY